MRPIKRTRSLRRRFGGALHESATKCATARPGEQNEPNDARPEWKDIARLDLRTRSGVGSIDAMLFRGGSRIEPVLLLICSALLLNLAFAPTAQFYLAWIGLVP